MTEKPGNHKRALRRHHAKRKKVWVRKTLGHYFMYPSDPPPRRVGMYSRTPKVCSCFMCGNPRRYSHEPTIQERRQSWHLRKQSEKSHQRKGSEVISLPKSAQSCFR